MLTGVNLHDDDPGQFGEMCRPLHHGLPFDEIREYIGNGSCVPVFANPVAPGIFLVLHDGLALTSGEFQSLNGAERPDLGLLWLL